MIETTSKTEYTNGSQPWSPPGSLYPLPDLANFSTLAVSDRERALYDDWRQLGGRSLYGSEGRYEVIDPGKLNTGPGPDFLSSLILFPDGEVRRGDIEIHLQRSGWRAHNHHDDPRYSEVILHLVLGGSKRRVRSVGGDITTIFLPTSRQDGTKPCQSEAHALRRFDQTHLKENLNTLAVQRWYDRCRKFEGGDQGHDLYLLAKRLGPGSGAVQLARAWREQLERHDSFGSFLERLGCGESIVPTTRREQKNLRRTRLLSAVAYAAMIEKSFFGANVWRQVQDLISKLQAAGYSLPNRHYALEIAGNWLLPWLATSSDRGRLDEWLALPIGWRYSRISQLTDRLGVSGPITFAEQQGWIEWERSLCDSGLCDVCPVGS